MINKDTTKPGIDRSLRVTFDRVAADYDAARPRYPESLINEVITLSGIPANGRILEVGCGPGIATIPFARRGYRMTCIELGSHLAALARVNCRDHPQVEIITCAFEDWSLERSAYDLFFSAEAFHWIPPEIGYPRAAAALKDGGSAALFWILDQQRDDDLAKAVDDVFLSWADKISAPERKLTPEWLIPIITENFKRCSSFGPVTVRQFAWSVNYSSERYAKLLGTRSANQLELGDKKRFLTEIAATVDAYGGRITMPLLSVLFHARKRD
jgi:SAM-dependent methyltransferase